MCCSCVDLIIALRYVEPYADWSCVNTLNKHRETVWCIKCAHKRSVYSCCFSWEGKYIVSCSGDNSIEISEIKGEKMEMVQEIKNAHEDEVELCLLS